jgi:hypothetical protein
MQALAVLILAGLALASSTSQAHTLEPIVVQPAAQLEAVDKFHFFGHLDGWRAVDRNTLIVWTTPFKPYLIELRRPASGLRFADYIGVTSTAGTVRARLDNIRVDGLRYPIKAIRPLTKQQARDWGRT